MLNKKHYYEKKIHKLTKRLKRMEKHPEAMSNYNKLHDLVTTKIESYNKAVRARGDA